MREPDKTDLAIPDFALVVLIGSTGSGKSTFAGRHFLPTEIISSDQCRALVCDNETDQDVSADAFELVREIAGKRLKHRKLAVIDATNVRAADRKAWIELARKWHALPVAVVIDPGVDVCVARNALRPDRPFGAGVVQRMTTEIRKGLGGLQREGFRQVWKLASEASIDAAKVSRQPLWTDKRDDHGPFDIIGDIHGCADELQALLTQLGYSVAWSEDQGERAVTVTPPEGRKIVFVGDLVDRGPNVPDALRIAMSMVAAGTAYCVQGNHERKLGRWLEGRKVTIAHGLQQTIDQLGVQDRGLREALPAFLDSLRSHVWLDGGSLAVAHAGLKEEMIGRGSGAVREFALYGETTGEIDEFGLPVRADWAAAYRGKTAVVYGHTPVLSAEWVNNTLCIDTGCVFGGKLTAFRWPERELVEVPAIQTWSEPVRPLGGSSGLGKSAQADADGVLDYQDVSGRRWIETELRGRVVVAEENASAALEVMSRFALSPQWLMYLPPTMSPSETSSQSGWLERPEEAFAHFRERGVTQIVCEEKHMGSRAVIALCRNAQTARDRFGVPGDETGAIWTRTGRSFFNDPGMTEGLLARLRARVEAEDIWRELDSDWLLLDAEIMPWSAKAGSLIESQYAPVATSAAAGLQASREALARAMARGVDAAALDARLEDRAARAARYATAWAPYMWPVSGIEDLKVAPFHLLASEGRVWFDQDHVWHMTLADRLAAGDGVVTRTQWRVVDLADASACAEAVAWWDTLTGSGGEGMVVKPRDFVSRNKKGIIQPALKVRGHEYLRIIYGPEYDAPDNLVRLRERGLSGKRNLALREFALGHEALKRFVARQPLRRVHECVFGVLALESEPIDPRL
ncbi:polynucleotide kinase-phosphatase [Mesorhizobium sp. NZP2234]|uniref:polynucleotide kinase-phosphatase n=1 Tax=Mesorhizobium sp. NZP2234 TaxID=2483402 RepID=UPI0015554784|nr:polynucleotide kinase-phosphatase [Mesorhizobium sp. NZP2234]QKC89184.1 polynucleotide kinase-phosphatase [Mesorhizobium sp. NZP2234]